MAPTNPIRVKVCFVMDCTASMEPWIQQAKTKIVSLVEHVKRQHPSADVEVGFIGYRDYGDEEPIIHIPFQYPGGVMRSIRGVFAEGGNDVAEDVAHGLHAALSLDWHGADVKILFHIADAPAHGMMFHAASVSDRFPRGDPHGLDPRDSVERMSFLNIDFTFVKIRNTTDTMIEHFHNCYGHGGTFTVMDLRTQGEDSFEYAVSESISQGITRHTISQEPLCCSQNPIPPSDYEE